MNLSNDRMRVPPVNKLALHLQAQALYTTSLSVFNANESNWELSNVTI